MRPSKPGVPTVDDAAAALAPFRVSRETRARLQTVVEELTRWQKAQNLVGPSTLAQVWSRHIADSLQLVALAPDARRWLDLGSGAGFPGLVIAIALMEAAPDEPKAVVHCVESNAKKCAFIRHAARLTGAPVDVHNARIESVIGGFVGSVDVVTARALAPLAQLLDWTFPLLTSGAVGLFPKGDQASAELTEARKSSTFTVDEFPSATDPRGRILRIATLAPT
ncbi:MAG: 16S rRNA (guanine(527)-N(7))-methyltransferase RsmG [Microvirga sp.]|nr:16S rRNA (guanine(527)-N(7))-methyltransferase RsmG [Microvirga sp.]